MCNSKLRILLCTIFLLCVSTGMLTISEAFTTSSLYASISGLLFLIFIFCIYKFDRTFFVINAYFLLLYLAFLFGVIWLEHGGFSYEISKQGTATGATMTLCVWLILFISTAAVIFKKVPIRYCHATAENKKPHAYALTLLLIVYMLAVVLLKGSSFGLGIDRLAYRNDTPLLWSIITVLSISMFYWGHECSKPSSNKQIIFFMLLGSNALLILTGDKVAGILWSIFSFGTGYFINKKIKLSLLFLALTAIITILLGTLFLYLISYHFITYYNISVVDGILSRFASQGQLWWFFSSFWDKPLGVMEFVAREVFGPPSGKAFGINGIELLMTLSAPQDYLVFAETSGSRFSDGFPAIILVYFGWFYGTIIILCLGVVWGVVSKILSTVLINGSYFEVLALFYLVYLPLHAALANGSYTVVFYLSIPRIICIIILVYYFFKGRYLHAISKYKLLPLNTSNNIAT